MNNLFVRIFAHLAYLFLTSNKGQRRIQICSWFHDRFVSTVNASVTLLDQNFPRSSMEERMEDGPITGFVKTIAPKVIIMLDNTVTEQSQQLVDTLDQIRQVGNK